MARILYGVMGNTHGHIMRTLSLVKRLPEHEYHFIGGGRVPDAVRGQWPCLEVPVLRTVHRRQRVSVPRTVGQIAACHLRLPQVTRRIRELIDRWQPDLAICDREFFLPHAARQAGLPCLSIDHSHLLKAGRYPVPAGEKVSWALAMANDYLFFDKTRHNLMVSFFHPPLRPSRRGFRDELFPAVVRDVVTRRSASAGEHVFVYQTSPTFHRLIETLRALPRRVVVYGFHNEDREEGNLSFRAYHPERILDDLASSAYAVVNGGHNLLSEAFYYGKPVLCFPVRTLFEQFFNAYHVRALGYGDYTTSMEPTPALFAAFEERLPEYRASIAANFREGTDQIVARLRELIADPAKIAR
ncbi:MAG: glycosyltransferase family protein [Verrucomicrobium sp.]|nr:glycosyltransferase family protein [Verrucomicrobium sp.]